MHPGARNPERGTDRGGHAAGRREGHDGLGQGTSPLDASRDAQQIRNFFLDVDDGLGAGQALRETGIVLSAAASSAASGLGSAVSGHAWPGSAR